MITRGYFVAPHRVLSARMVSLCDLGFGVLLLECSHVTDAVVDLHFYIYTILMFTDVSVALEHAEPSVWLNNSKQHKQRSSS